MSKPKRETDATILARLKRNAKQTLTAELGAEKFGSLLTHGRLGFIWLHSPTGRWFGLFFSRVSGVTVDVWRVTAGASSEGGSGIYPDTEVSVTRPEVDAAVRWAVETVIAHRIDKADPAVPRWLEGNNWYCWSRAANKLMENDPMVQKARPKPAPAS